MFLPTCEESETSHVFSGLSNLRTVDYEPVGRWFEACLKRQRSENSVSVCEDNHVEENILDEENEAELTCDEVTFLMSLDPAEWKKQDHYRVLGLEEKRSLSTDEDIKQAYRKKVLQHHPDKKDKSRKSRLPPGINEHGYFTCITKAYELLSTKTGRQAYDSVDPSFNDSVPSFNSTKDDFFKVFEPIIKSNARWSQEQPALLLGDMNSTQEEVNLFYSFWYEFKSWRNFAYMDEEDPEKAESREERRWMERENKHMRQKRKKDELSRIRSIVELAFNNDPRLKKFKDVERQRKLEIKQAKELAIQEKEQQRKLELEKERQMKEQAEQEAKEKAAKEKKEKDKMKKAAARDRKVIRQSVKSENYFDTNNEEEEIKKLEKSLENLSIENLQTLREKAEGDDKNEFKTVYLKFSGEILEKLKQEDEKRKQDEAASIAAANKQAVEASKAPEHTWNDIEKQLLVKATTLFPVGTASRWDVIASYINEHSGSEIPKTGKQVISKVKNLKKLDPSLKEEVNKMAYKNLEKSTNSKNANAIQNQNDISVKDPGVVETAWSSDEQKLLEQALKKFDSKTPERWEKISAIIPSRTKKECMKRYKELVEIIKAKKAAASA